MSEDGDDSVFMEECSLYGDRIFIAQMILTSIELEILIQTLGPEATLSEALFLVNNTAAEVRRELDTKQKGQYGTLTSIDGGKKGET